MIIMFLRIKHSNILLWLSLESLNPLVTSRVDRLNAYQKWKVFFRTRTVLSGDTYVRT